MLTRPRCSPLIALTLLSVVGCAHQDRQPGPQPRDGVLIHLHSSPQHEHALLMGLKMARLMSEQHDVLIYVDVDAIPLVLRNGPNLNREPYGSSRMMLAHLLDADVPVYACPTCLEAARHTPGDLLAGVQLAQREGFFSFTDGRILTFDY